jgi:lipopolysaccharide/colanic/teichoic acid biosynthesis glycosyltransferase
MTTLARVGGHGHSQHLAAYRGRRRTDLFLKRLMDVVVCAMALPIALVIGILCAVAIWLDSPGPILLRQPRTGLHGRRFRMYKFRTMVPNAEELKASLAHLNILPPPDFKIPDDPRITRVGRVLRKTSLDELPQLLNVLAGQMSLVGPRPTSFAVSTYRLWHAERLEVRPGITGIWQVRARGSSTFDERLRMDIEYIDRMSPILDLQILGLTVISMIKRSGA